MRISDWSSDVCSSALLAFRDLVAHLHLHRLHHAARRRRNLHRRLVRLHRDQALLGLDRISFRHQHLDDFHFLEVAYVRNLDFHEFAHKAPGYSAMRRKSASRWPRYALKRAAAAPPMRSEEHTH